MTVYREGRQRGYVETCRCLLIGHFLCAAYAHCKETLWSQTAERFKKPTIIVLNKDEIRVFLEKASTDNWYLEILLGLFMGLRKGEILGLKYGDFNFEQKTVTISRQITVDPIVPKGQGKISEYQVVEKNPKTLNSYRTLRVPDAIMEELAVRKMLNDARKRTIGELSKGTYIVKKYIYSESECKGKGVSGILAGI